MVTHSVVPWATCLRCRRWYMARAPRRHCSCRHAAMPSTWTCCICGTTGAYKGNGRLPRYCSPRCRAQSPRSQAARRTAKQVRRARLKGAECERFDPVTVFERDGWRCGICGYPMDPALKVPHPQAPTLDHVVPLSKGGPHTQANTQCAHAWCNWLKSDHAEKVGAGG